ncbi:TIGR03943 family putative permease subunit [Oribacterium parvum]
MEEISKKNSRDSRNIGMNSSMDSRLYKRFMKSAIGSRAVYKKIFLLLPLFVLCLALTSCKKANNIRKVGSNAGVESSGENASSLSEEEALKQAKELESLEQKEQESLDKEYGTEASSEAEGKESGEASDKKSVEADVKESEKGEGAYPYDDYPYDPKEDRGKVNLDKPDIVVGDKHYATQINDWYMNFQDYEGKTVSIDGYYMNFGGYTLVGRMGPSCPYCTGGYVNFEFKTDLDLSKLKSEESWIRVKGILRKGKYSISKDVSQLIYYIEALEVEELPEVGVDTVAD